MNISASIVKVIVTLPVIGTVSRNEPREVVKKGQSYRVHIYAAKPGLREGKVERDFLTVGVLTGAGYTTGPFKRLLNVFLPEGMELVALNINEDGIASSWDSLPIHIDQWFSPTGSMIITGFQEVNIQDGMLAKAIIEQLKKELKPGGLLYKAKH